MEFIGFNYRSLNYAVEVDESINSSIQFCFSPLSLSDSIPLHSSRLRPRWITNVKTEFKARGEELDRLFVARPV